MTREKIKMVSGVPHIVTLEDTNAKPMTSRFHDGTEYLYSVMHRGAACLLYLPVEGHQAIQRLGARAGDEVQLVKQQTQGQAPTFTARAVSDARLAVPAAPPQHVQPAPVAQGVRMLAPQTQYAPAPEAARLAPPPAQVHPLEEIMQRCFVVAGRALWNAHHELDAAGDDGGGGVDGRADQREQRRLDFFQLLADLHRGRLLGCRAAEPDREARLE